MRSRLHIKLDSRLLMRVERAQLPFRLDIDMDAFVGGSGAASGRKRGRDDDEPVLDGLRSEKV